MTEFGDGDRNGEPSEGSLGCIPMVVLIMAAALVTAAIMVFAWR